MNAKSTDQQLNKFNNDFFQASVDEFSVILHKGLRLMPPRTSIITTFLYRYHTWTHFTVSDRFIQILVTLESWRASILRCRFVFTFWSYFYLITNQFYYHQLIAVVELPFNVNVINGMALSMYHVMTLGALLHTVWTSVLGERQKWGSNAGCVAPTETAPGSIWLREWFGSTRFGGN